MSFLTKSFHCSINSDVFYASWYKSCYRKLNQGAVIVMDNATFHKRYDMLTAIEDHGCIVEFLPPYCPNLNPIEKKWAQVKSMRRKLHCSINNLFVKHTDYRNLC